MEREYKNLKLILSFLVVLSMIIPLVNAFGVTTNYFESNPLIMHPGQVKDINVLLQNMVGDEELTLQAEITEGSEIATLMDSNKEYVVPLGRKDIEVNIRVAIPENASLEEKYNIKVSFKQISKEEGGMVQMAQGIGTAIPIMVKSVEEVPIEPEDTQKTEATSISPLATIILVFAIIAIIIAWIILKKREKK